MQADHAFVFACCHLVIRAGLLHFESQALTVEPGEYLARNDDIAFLDQDFHDFAVDASEHRCVSIGAECRRRVVGRVNLGLDGGDDLDGQRGAGRLDNLIRGTGLADAAGGNQHRARCRKRRDDCPL